ncbi:MAG: hypothetical protein V5804_15550 [Mucilaginibacter sp.]|uniref:hypothetical protein n=1 Tax=Mucilaginibacter sp. TaxID=1882438 RepID=UPI0034E5995E
MATFTINTEDKKSEKALKAILKVLEIDYQVQSLNKAESKPQPFNKKEKQLYESLKNTFHDIEKWKKGELEFKDARTLLDEL